MNGQMKNIIIGIFVIVTSMIIIWALLYLRPSIGDSGTTLYVRFSDIDKISVDSRVTFAGRHVGEVKAIRQLEDSRNPDQVAHGKVYAYELTLVLDSSVQVYDNDEIAIRTSGLLGEKSIAIIPRPFPPDHTPLLMNEKIMFAKGGGSVEEALDELRSFTQKARSAMDQIVALINVNGEELTLAIESMHLSAEHLQGILGNARDTKLIGTLQETSARVYDVMNETNKHLQLLEHNGFPAKLAELTSNLASISTAINSPDSLRTIVTNLNTLSENLAVLSDRIDNSWDNVDSSLKDFDSITSQARGIINDTRSGKNSLGKLLGNDDLYVHFLTTFNKVETLLNDVNHYGLLFHLDKGWQRQRTKRINILRNLSTPDQFQDYFEEEIDQVTTSLSRISELLIKTRNMENVDAKQYDTFITLYSNLLYKINDLGNSLKAYNVQVLEKQTQ